eukprot:TRINITY_DN30_c2_g1_i1.p1 TRINITY_DN30_c2_g1~~TRINITY_DN30_c2_g1_i1.p1  ORF type:complete len:473 (-),score=100.00 TRINITY_DN30_c2_g1_i1:84-1502(-)
MLDVTLFRPEGNVELVRESQKRRGQSQATVDAVIDADAKWKAGRFALDRANQERNKLNEEIGKKKRAKEDADDLIAKRNELEVHIEKLKAEEKALENAVNRVLKPIGNIVHASVPVSDNEDDNLVVKTWGEFPKTEGLLHHHELLYMIDGYDPERGVKVAGHRAYFLTGMGLDLNQALIRYGLDFLKKKGYKSMQTPFFMKKDVMGCTAQLEQFDEELYKVVGKSKTETPGEDDDDKYLIATSEQPISAYHMDEWLEPKQLPLKYAGYSTCFRKEAGSHGKDTWGIFRVHQFEKVEQFVLTAPEDSWAMHETMLANSEEFFQSLGIPYRVVSIVSGALNNAAAKKYDLEGWFPGYQEFRELVSCSNCTDYQSRELGVRCGIKKQGEREKKFVHMLNSTLVATTRGICAVLENGQCAEGIRVPEALRPYLGGITIIPFVNPPPKPKGQAAKAAAKPKAPAADAPTEQMANLKA